MDDLNHVASHCPNCLAEYREGFDTCADCGTRLVPGPAPLTTDHAPEGTKGKSHPETDRDDPPVVLCRLPPLDAEMLAGRLQAEGLTAQAEYRSRLFVWGDVVPDMALCRVWVVRSQLGRAQAIARKALSGEDAI